MQTIVGTIKQFNNVYEVFTGFWGSKVSIIFFFFSQMIPGQPGLTEQIQDLKPPRRAHSSSDRNAKSSAKRSFISAVMLGTPGNSSSSNCNAGLSGLKLTFTVWVKDSVLFEWSAQITARKSNIYLSGARWGNQFGLTMAEGVQEGFGKLIWKHNLLLQFH